ncbi:hypothetical protein [Candidatus Entotheonella palauensis]|uniref:hypothetical protein n=1 Tax=Candidatus Entotheonella palauensis TaxID=93172 RepID=UPI000B7F6E65|nr:hypothetical protein [Candidatus Entotheonella palauensis]
MTSSLRMTPFFLVAIVALCLGGTASDARTGDDDDEIPFDVAKIFIALNDTDEDLGIAAFIDGEGWRKLIIYDADEERILTLRVTGRLRQQGLTEFAIESREPGFDELSPATFFRRFPEGEYEVEGITLDGQTLEGEVELSHVLPAPPSDLRVSGRVAPEDCDEDPIPTIRGPVEISWEPVTGSHPDIGKSGDVDIVEYEVVVESEDLVFSVRLLPLVTSVEIPEAFIEQADEFSVEILVTAANGNRTATESCFEVD